MSEAEFEIEGLSGSENEVSGDFGDDGPGHMTSFRAPELETEGGGADDVVPVDQETGEPVADLAEVPEVEQITKAAFFTAFKHSFGLPGLFLPMWKPLAVQDDEVEIARDASDAIYELLEIYFPSALMPQSENFMRVTRAAPFILAKIMVVRMILEESRRAKIDAMKQRQAQFRSVRGDQDAAPAAGAPANEDYAPPPGAQSPMAWADGEAA
ncbi:hypothetical protein AB9K35_01285 [Leisingera sp. XS_AS12]|uniref:hypothetical protein n=1 Tax=Leisingera sp. XS_AS12 TaxID=3241294 RepID=UPI0035142747